MLRRVWSGTAIFALMVSSHAGADTLQSALSSALATDPRLGAEAAKSQSAEEDVHRARAGFLPVASVTARIARSQYETEYTRFVDKGSLRPKGMAVELQQPLFSGFRIVNRYRQAMANSQAAQSRLAKTVGDVLAGAATAYADLYRSRKALGLRHRQVENLQQLLSKTLVREKSREVTQTDLDQVRLRLETARDQELIEAANLRDKEASYQRATSTPPGPLAALPTNIVALPHSIDAALAEVDGTSPALAEARSREVAAQHALDVVRGEMFPDVSLRVSHTRDADSVSGTNSSQDTLGELRFSMKLFDGGERMARIEQAKLDQLVYGHATADLKRELERGLRSAWGTLESARRQLESGRRRIEFAKRALGGVRTEEAVGQRSLLDILNAENELVEAEIAVLASERDVVVQSFLIVSLVGGPRVFDVVDTLEMGRPGPKQQLLRTAEVPEDGWHTVTHVGR